MNTNQRFPADDEQVEKHFKDKYTNPAQSDVFKSMLGCPNCGSMDRTENNTKCFDCGCQWQDMELDVQPENKGKLIGYGHVNSYKEGTKSIPIFDCKPENKNHFVYYQEGEGKCSINDPKPEHDFASCADPLCRKCFMPGTIKHHPDTIALREAVELLRYVKVFYEDCLDHWEIRNYYNNKIQPFLTKLNHENK